MNGVVDATGMVVVVAGAVVVVVDGDTVAVVDGVAAPSGAHAKATRLSAASRGSCRTR